MAVGAEGLFGVWGGFQPVLVPAVPAAVRRPRPYFLISPVGGGPVTHLQQGAPIAVSKSLCLVIHHNFESPVTIVTWNTE